MKKKTYIAPSIRVLRIEGGENLLAASGNNTLMENSSGTETQSADPSSTTNSVDGNQALGKKNIFWDLWDE